MLPALITEYILAYQHVADACQTVARRLGICKVYVYAVAYL